MTSLATLISQLKYTRAAVNHGDPSRGLKHKVNLLAAVLEAEGPDTIRIKKGPDAGKEVSLLKIVIGDEEGQVCRLTAWREVAERWGGSYPDETSLQRGDVVYLQGALPLQSICRSILPEIAKARHRRTSFRRRDHLISLI